VGDVKRRYVQRIPAHGAALIEIRSKMARDQ
jgi:hypothetical protein